MATCGPGGELECPCPPVGLIDLVGKKWAVCVVAMLGRYGTLRFGPIQRCLTGVSPATLTSTLRALERARLVHRPTAEGARGTVRAYALTVRGRTLYETLRPLTDWLRDSPSRRGTVISEGPVGRRGGPRVAPEPRRGPGRAQA